MSGMRRVGRKCAGFSKRPISGRSAAARERTFAEYEAYAGLSFLHRIAQDATLRGESRPNPPAPAAWATEPREWRVRIVLDRAAVAIGSLGRTRNSGTSASTTPTTPKSTARMP